ARCTFCLWPQVTTGHTYRVRSVGNVLDEVSHMKCRFPKMKELFFDDDTFTADPPRAREIAQGLGRLGITWSTNSRANVDRETQPARIQVSLASPYTGTAFYDFVTKNNYLTVDSLVDETGYQKCTVSYPEVSADEIFKAVETFYRRYYFTPRYIWKSVKKMASSREEAKRLLGEGVQFIGSMAKRRRIASETRKGVSRPETSAQA